MSDDGCDYPVENLIWHCENTPPSAHPQLREELLNFPFDRPDSCFRISHWKNLFVYVPSFLSFIKDLVRLFFGCVIQCIEHIEQPIDDADEIYNKNLALILDFFSSKLHLYYSSSQLTLLLTFLSTSQPQFLRTDSIPLPSRLKIIDEESLDLYATAGWYPDKYSWHIFQNFLNSDDPLALEERRYAVAALACLKILFGHSQLLVSRITWLTNTPALSGSIWKTIPDGNIKITRLQSTGDLDSTGTSGLTIAIRCYKNRVSGTDSSNSIGKVQFKIIAQTTFYSFYKILRTPTTFSTSLVIECSDLDTYIESIPHTSKRLFLPSRHTLNESRERRARSGLVSRFGGGERWFSAQ